jgi:pyruvate formate lyase activating enzyme
VEILCFHQMGRERRYRLAITYPLEDAELPDAELRERMRGQLRSRRLTVH